MIIVDILWPAARFGMRVNLAILLEPKCHKLLLFDLLYGTKVERLVASFQNGAGVVSSSAVRRSRSWARVQRASSMSGSDRVGDGGQLGAACS